jgi:hypothetical protein
MIENNETPIEDEPVESISEVLSATVDALKRPAEESPTAKKKATHKTADVPDYVRAEAGDSYLSLAVRYFPTQAAGVVAPQLVKLNLNRPIREGVKIKLKESK